MRVNIAPADRKLCIRNLMVDRAALAGGTDPTPVPAPRRMAPRSAQKDALVAKAVRVVNIPEAMTPKPTVSLGVVKQTGGLSAESGSDGAIIVYRDANGSHMLCGAIPARPRMDIVNELASLNGAVCGAYAKAVKAMGPGFQARILGYAVTFFGVGTHEGPEGILVPATSTVARAVANGAATPAQEDLWAQCAAWGMVAIADAATPRQREAEKTIASFAAGAAAMSARDKAGGGHSVNSSPTSHGRKLAAFTFHNLAALEAPPTAGVAAEVVLTSAGPGNDSDPAVASSTGVEVMKALTDTWAARRHYLAPQPSPPTLLGDRATSCTHQWDVRLMVLCPLEQGQ